MTRLSKFYIALTGGGLTWATAITVSPSGPVTAAEWVTGAGVAVTAIAVWFVPNS